MSSYYFIENLISQGWATRASGQGATEYLTPWGQQLGALIVPL
jgi:hypothetical protein